MTNATGTRWREGSAVRSPAHRDDESRRRSWASRMPDERFRAAAVLFSAPPRCGCAPYRERERSCHVPSWSHRWIERVNKPPCQALLPAAVKPKIKTLRAEMTLSHLARGLARSRVVCGGPANLHLYQVPDNARSESAGSAVATAIDGRFADASCCLQRLRRWSRAAAGSSRPT